MVRGTRRTRQFCKLSAVPMTSLMPDFEQPGKLPHTRTWEELWQTDSNFLWIEPR